MGNFSYKQLSLGLKGNKIFIEQPSPEPKVRVMIPMYEPLEVVKCRKCES
jgi:hypothetical protein